MIAGVTGHRKSTRSAANCRSSLPLLQCEGRPVQRGRRMVDGPVAHHPVARRRRSGKSRRLVQTGRDPESRWPRARASGYALQHQPRHVVFRAGRPRLLHFVATLSSDVRSSGRPADMDRQGRSRQADTARRSPSPIIAPESSVEENLAEGAFALAHDGRITLVYSSSGVSPTYVVNGISAPLDADLTRIDSWRKWSAPLQKSVTMPSGEKDYRRYEQGPGHAPSPRTRMASPMSTIAGATASVEMGETRAYAVSTGRRTVAPYWT